MVVPAQEVGVIVVTIKGDYQASSAAKQAPNAPLTPRISPNRVRGEIPVAAKYPSLKRQGLLETGMRRANW
jgi:hypothetical protein